METAFVLRDTSRATGETVHRKQPPLQDGKRTACGGDRFVRATVYLLPKHRRLWQSLRAHGGQGRDTPLSYCLLSARRVPKRTARAARRAMVGPRRKKLVRRGGVALWGGTDDGRTALERGRSIGLDRRAAERRCGHRGATRTTRIARIVGWAAARLGCRRCRAATGRDCRENRQHQEPAHGWLPPQKCVRFPGARLWVKQLYPTVLDVQMKHVDIFQPSGFPRVEKVLQFTWPPHSG